MSQAIITYNVHSYQTPKTGLKKINRGSKLMVVLTACVDCVERKYGNITTLDINLSHMTGNHVIGSNDNTTDRKETRSHHDIEICCAIIQNP